MLNADQVNVILDAMFTTFDARVPNLTSLQVTQPEPVNSTGAYGSVILGALFTGGLEGKLTLAFDWAMAFQIAEAISGTKIEGFSDVAQQALIGMFQEAVQIMADRFAGAGVMLDIRILPTLVDTSVLLSEGGDGGAIRLPLQADQGAMNLYLSFK